MEVCRLASTRHTSEMLRATALLAILLLLSASVVAEEAESLASATERGRSLARILDAALAPGGSEEQGPRTLVLLLDSTKSLRTAAFATEFRAAIARNEKRLSETRIGVVSVGDDGPAARAPTHDHAAVVKAVEDLSAKPGKALLNVYRDVRRMAATLSGASGRKDLLLVTLENGDAEEGVEATAAILRRTGVRLLVIAREAFLSDTYWITHQKRPPRGVTLAGADSAFVEVPWGYLFQQSVVNEGVSSGFAMYGISRITARSGGKVYLFYPQSKTGHLCVTYGGCLFCSRDHSPRGRSYQTHRLRDLAPHGGSRSEVYRAAGRDPYFRAVLRAWGRASKAGIVRSRPSVKAAGSSLKPEKRQQGSGASLAGSLKFSSQASRADRLARTCSEIADDLDADIRAVESSNGSPRYRAIADLTRVMLLVTRVNLLYFAAFCRETAPALSAPRAAELPPPELPLYSPDLHLLGIGYTTLSFCHGAGPYREVRMPGGEAMDRELAELVRTVDGFLSRHQGTPFAEALHKSGLARFTFTVRGKYVPPSRRNIPTQEGEGAATDRDRPERGGSEGGGGTTTGGD
jgi:hypothetical protein